MPSTGYTRQSAAGIVDSAIITASLFNAEYNKLQDAFDAVNGHVHDGSAGQGGRVLTLGPAGELVASGTNFTPKTDAAIDLGTSGLRFRDAYLSRNLTIGGTLGATGAATLGGTLAVTGATTLSNTLAVTGAATLSSTLAVTGTASAADATAATHLVNRQTGDARYLQLAGTQTVTGTTTFNNPVTLPDATAATHAVNRQFGDGRYMLKSGSSSTGFLGVANPTASSLLYLDKQEGFVAGIYGRRDTAGAKSSRWYIQLGTSTAEAGSNSGSNFTIQRFDDSGTLINAPLTIARDTGIVSFATPPTIGGNAVWYPGNFKPADYLPLTGGTLTGGITAPSHLLDVNGYLTLQGGHPILAFDSNDYLIYNRTTNSLGLSIGGVSILTASATDITSTVPVVLPANPTSALQAVPKQYVDGAAGRTAIGATAVGGNLITAADAASARATIVAPTLPNVTASTPGHWTLISPGPGTSVTLPGGGTWAYFLILISNSSGATVGTNTAGTAAGGTTVASAVAGNGWIGFAWRIT